MVVVVVLAVFVRVVVVVNARLAVVVVVVWWSMVAVLVVALQRVDCHVLGLLDLLDCSNTWHPFGFVFALVVAVVVVVGNIVDSRRLLVVDVAAWMLVFETAFA